MPSDSLEEFIRFLHNKINEELAREKSAVALAFMLDKLGGEIFISIEDWRNLCERYKYAVVTSKTTEEGMRVSFEVVQTSDSKSIN